MGGIGTVFAGLACLMVNTFTIGEDTKLMKLLDNTAQHAITKAVDAQTFECMSKYKSNKEKIKYLKNVKQQLIDALELMPATQEASSDNSNEPEAQKPSETSSSEKNVLGDRLKDNRNQLEIQISSINGVLDDLESNEGHRRLIRGIKPIDR